MSSQLLTGGLWFLQSLLSFITNQEKKNPNVGAVKFEFETKLSFLVLYLTLSLIKTKKKK